MLPKNVALTAAAYTIGGLCYCKLLPWFTLPVALAGCFSRWSFDIHVRTHSPHNYGLLEELMLLVMSPLSVGLNEQRSLHLQHHSYLGTPKDPDWFYYNAHPVASFLFCMIHLEITFARSFPSMTVFAKVRSFCRLLLFVTLWAIGGANFLLWYLLPLRLMFGSAQFVFTWLLHHRTAETTIDLALPDWSTLLIGKVGMRELRGHKKHHGQSVEEMSDRLCLQSLSEA